MSINDGNATSRERMPVAERGLERKLGLAEALGLSLSIVAPSMAMAFNVSLVVRAAGRAAPLAFVIGTIALGIVALSFVSFSRRVAHAGSAYAYIGQTFGWRWGFVAGWTLLLTYLTYAAGVSALATLSPVKQVRKLRARPSGCSEKLRPSMTFKMRCQLLSEPTGDLSAPMTSRRAIVRTKNEEKDRECESMFIHTSSVSTL